MFFGFCVPCEILRITNIELPSFIPSSLAIINEIIAPLPTAVPLLS